MSFVVKWVVSLLIFIAYLVYARYMLRPGKKPKAEKLISAIEKQEATSNNKDVFDNIRKKKTLLSKADLVIKRNL